MLLSLCDWVEDGVQVRLGEGDAARPGSAQPRPTLQLERRLAAVTEPSLPLARFSSRLVDMGHTFHLSLLSQGPGRASEGGPPLHATLHEPTRGSSSADTGVKQVTDAKRSDTKGCAMRLRADAGMWGERGGVLRSTRWMDVGGVRESRSRVARPEGGKRQASGVAERQPG